jgi:hypothetical protein
MMGRYMQAWPDVIPIWLAPMAVAGLTPLPAQNETWRETGGK